MPDPRSPPSRQRPKRKIWFVFLALAASLAIALVQINVSLIANYDRDGTILFGPSENRYDAGAPVVKEPQQQQPPQKRLSNSSKLSGKPISTGENLITDSQSKNTSNTNDSSSSSNVISNTATILSVNKTKAIRNTTKIQWPEGHGRIPKDFSRENRTKIKLQGKRKGEDMPLEMDILVEDGPVFEAPIINPDTKDFDPNLNGVIVTKVQGYQKDVDSLVQMLCLLTKAYNQRVNHDIVIFTSEAIPQADIEAFQKIVHPANLTVAIDNPGLHQMVDDLSPTRKQHLYERCNVTSTKELTWRTKCWEVSSNRVSRDMIAYNWQAEFRALWIWIHPLLAPYKYMMWFDSDAFCSKAWEKDPFAVMERHDLALLFDHFPQGSARGYEFPRLTEQVFDRIICRISLVNGTLVASDGRCKNRKKSRLANVHGFFHVSSLDFYRSDPVMKWNRAMIGETKFSRLFDDQIGITIPAAVLAGNRSRDMSGMGIYPRVHHNYFLDGRKDHWRGAYTKWFQKNAKYEFPEADGQCRITMSS